jgi:phenylpropionate dioxygenase-like ring-hydroxylating dioxygenase large terminal subunit
MLAKSSTNPACGAPPADRFPLHPATWYPFCSVPDLARGPLSRDFLGRRLVAFRTDHGKIGVLDARCSHLGADLGRGTVVDETIQCPYHHWRYGTDGFCRHIPTLNAIPESACQTAYPSVERFGHVFIFNGRTALFPFPEFADATDVPLTGGTMIRFEATCPWYLVAANGFDRSHYLSVHDRAVIGEPVVDTPSPFARRIRYQARIVGNAVADTILRRLAGPAVDVSITCWGGALFFVTARYRRANSYIVISTRPIHATRSETTVIPCAPQPRHAMGRLMAKPVGMRVRRYFTREFLRKDFDRLDGLRYNPHSLVESDREMIEFFNWIVDLPQTNPQGDPHD